MNLMLFSKVWPDLCIATIIKRTKKIRVTNTGDPVRLRWQLDSPIISGVLVNCSAISSLLLPEASQSERDAAAKKLSVTLPSQNDRGDGEASILCLTLLRPNALEDA